MLLLLLDAHVRANLIHFFYSFYFPCARLFSISLWNIITPLWSKFSHTRARLFRCEYVAAYGYYISCPLRRVHCTCVMCMRIQRRDKISSHKKIALLATNLLHKMWETKTIANMKLKTTKKKNNETKQSKMMVCFTCELKSHVPKALNFIEAFMSVTHGHVYLLFSRPKNWTIFQLIFFFSFKNIKQSVFSCWC